MTEELIDFNNIITLRNHLCRVPMKRLLEMYQDKESYITFLDSIALLAENDSAFLLFADELLEKILSIVQIHRFDFEEKEVKDCINGIIGYVNQIKTYPDGLANVLRNGYLTYQEDLREADFLTTEGLLTSLSYDAVVFACLRDGDIHKIQDDEYALMSLNYLMKSVPEFFKDPQVCLRVQTLLDRIGKNSKLLSSKKKFVKKIRTNFENFIQKEE